MTGQQQVKSVDKSASRDSASNEQSHKIRPDDDIGQIVAALQDKSTALVDEIAALKIQHTQLQCQTERTNKNDKSASRHLGSNGQSHEIRPDDDIGQIVATLKDEIAALVDEIAALKIQYTQLQCQMEREAHLVPRLTKLQEPINPGVNGCLNYLAFEAIRAVYPGGPLTPEWLADFLSRAVNLRHPIRSIILEEAGENMEDLTNYLKAVVTYMDSHPSYKSTKTTIKRINRVLRLLKRQSTD